MTAFVIRHAFYALILTTFVLSLLHMADKVTAGLSAVTTGEIAR